MDLSDDSVPDNESLGAPNIDLLPYKKREENYYLIFKAVSFIIAILLGAYFLCIGLKVASDSAKHIREIQTSAIQLKIEQLKYLSGKTSVLQPKNKAKENKKDLKHRDEANVSSDSFIISTGSLLTLVAFIFGVGLTLLLSVLKFVFIRDEDKQKENSADIATPLSELIKGLANWLKKKAS